MCVHIFALFFYLQTPVLTSRTVEDKYKKTLQDDDDDESSTDEDEDDLADLATADLDNEIFATLNAIRNKDPRVYDAKTTFYTAFDPEAASNATAKKEKPMTLSDYHRKNLLEGHVDGAEEDGEAPVQTYEQEQEALKDSVVRQMHAAAEEDDEEDDVEGDFLVRKSKPAVSGLPASAKVHKDRAPKISDLDIENADKDPEMFLSNFMAARAWVPSEGSRWQAFESEDEEDDKRADEFEEAYNLRFEDPAKANEKLMTFGRDVGKYSARREELSGRKKQREKERAKKEELKQEREEEKARLRKLKIEEMEEKVKRIKEAAGLKVKDALDLDEWGKVLEEDWDDDRWEREMKKRFGENYYAEDDQSLKSEDEAEVEGKKHKKPSKPKWDDDIDIKDLVPDFEDDEEKPAFTLSDEDEDADMVDADETAEGKRKTKKDRLQERADTKRVARKERAKIEQLADAAVAADLPSTSSGFRYRETSPSSFGLTARDILFADDSQLNQFAGLKKMAAFRDEEKKRKDKKKLGKKARLRQWRKDTFGKEDPPEGFQDFFKSKGLGDEPAVEGAKEGGGKKKRGKKRKAGAAEA